MTACQWFKLLLDANTKRTDYDDPQLDRATGSGLMRLPPGKSGKQILTDYLKLVHQHVFEQLGTMIGAMVVKQTAFRFQVSLPSAWSFAAREATRQAAIEAGFGSGNNDELYLIDEPEAAAIWAIKSTERTVHDDKFQVSALQQQCTSLGFDNGAEKYLPDFGGYGRRNCRYRFLRHSRDQAPSARGGMCRSG